MFTWDFSWNLRSAQSLLSFWLASLYKNSQKNISSLKFLSGTLRIVVSFLSFSGLGAPEKPTVRLRGQRCWFEVALEKSFLRAAAAACERVPYYFSICGSLAHSIPLMKWKLKFFRQIGCRYFIQKSFVLTENWQWLWQIRQKRVFLVKLSLI